MGIVFGGLRIDMKCSPIYISLPNLAVKFYKHLHMKTENKTTLGAAYGVAFGIIIGVLVDNIGLWLSLGIAIGCGVGSYLDQQEKGNTNDPKE
ncbi:hypothetical protein N9887_00980 [Flavobacteriaceae bacterium]|nr:hypothetical protein [Flavobacteriaceae bacterium]